MPLGVARGETKDRDAGLLTAEGVDGEACNQEQGADQMNSKSVLKAAASLTVAAGLALGAGSFVQAPVQAADTAKVQLADAAQMAAVKERQELMKTIGGNAKKITRSEEHTSELSH